MIKENIIKYITNNLNEADTAEVRELINTDTEYKKEFIGLKNLINYSLFLIIINTNFFIYHLKF